MMSLNCTCRRSDASKLTAVFYTDVMKTEIICREFVKSDKPV